MATLDSTTQSEYAAEVNAADRAQVILDALVDPVSVKIYNGADAVVASGTMTTPWATIVDDTILPTTLDGLFSTVTDEPDSSWYLKFESGARYVRLSFGLSGSGKEAEWSLGSFTVGTQAGISDSVITVTGNRPPVWTGAPTTLERTAGSTQSFASYASDPDGDGLTFSLVSATNGYSITPAGVLTVGTVSQSVTIQVTDPDGLYADHVCAVTASGATAATFTVSANGSTVTTRKVSNGQTWTSAIIDGSTIGAVAGDIIEFAGGTYPKVTLRNFTGASLVNPITVRNKIGQVVVISGTSFPFEIRGNTYLTIDGSNGMAAWTPYNSTAAHGFRVTVPTTTTVPTAYVKHFGIQKGLRYKRIEVDGRKIVQSNGMMNVFGSDIGFATNDQTLSSTAAANNGKWGNEDIEFIECYAHHTCGENAYLGVNFNTIAGGSGLPNKDMRATRCRFTHSGAGGVQLKSCWGGTNNGFDGCVVLYAGIDITEIETGHGHGIQSVGNGAVRNCWVEQSRESGIKSYWDDGPNPVADSNSPTGYSQIIGTNRWPVYNTYEMEISNNVILRAGGSPCLDGVAQTGPVFIGGTRPTPITLVAHGVTIGGNAGAKFRPKVFSNTIVDSDEFGVNLGNVATGGIVANNLILGSNAGATRGTSGQTVQGNITTGTKANIFQTYVTSFVLNGPNADDLHLKIAQGPATGARGTHYTATDKDGDVRGFGSTGATAPDVGAYEYP